jgi:hypothetical protein
VEDLVHFEVAEDRERHVDELEISRKGRSSAVYPTRLDFLRSVARCDDGNKPVVLFAGLVCFVMSMNRGEVARSQAAAHKVE